MSGPASGVHASGLVELVRPCPVCDAPRGLPLMEVGSLPVFANVLRETREVALAAERAPLRLVLCAGCGHLHNDRFEPGRMAYGEGYENALHFSAVFRSYAEELARGLVERHDLRGKHVLEIGCGRGDFLRLLCELGGNRGTGFDPSWIDRGDGPGPRAPYRILPVPFDAASADVPADLVCCRHVLEHLEHPLTMLGDLRRTLGGRRPLVFFEVPDGLWTLERGGLWDVIYEHYGYFTPLSLRRAFRRAGYRVLAERSTYGGQFLTIEALPGEREPAGCGAEEGEDAELARLLASGHTFAQRWRQALGHWSAVLGGHASAGRSVVLWGAGSKGVTFLNVLGEAAGAVRAVVDLNPAKHGRFVSGTGQVIVAPEQLLEVPPAAVVVMNPIYRDEIQAQLSRLRVSAEVLVA